MSNRPFQADGATITLAVTTSSAGSTAAPTNSAQVRVYNAGPNLCFIRFGQGTMTATTSDMPLAVGATEIFTKGGASGVAAICGTGTATVYVTPGAAGA